MSPQPKTFGELRQSQWSEERFANRGVRQELRENLLCKMEKGEPLFPGVHGYDDTVIPQIVNAVLSRHHFILLGLRGQAKIAHHPRADGFYGLTYSVRGRLRDSRQSLQAVVPPLPRTRCRRRQRHTDRVAFARPPLRGEAGYAGCDHCGHDWRHGSDQSGARRPSSCG